MRKKIILLILLIFCAGTCGDGGSRTGNAAEGPLAEGTIGPEGGRIEVDRPGHPLDGASVDVPAYALSEPTKFSIGLSYARMAPGFAPQLTPVAVLEPAGQLFLLPATITLPSVKALLTAGTPMLIAGTRAGPTGLAEVFGRLVDTDLSDGNVSFELFVLNEAAVFAIPVDAENSEVRIVDPPEVGMEHRLTAGDPGSRIRIEVKLRSTVLLPSNGFLTPSINRYMQDNYLAMFIEAPIDIRTFSRNEDAGMPYLKEQQFSNALEFEFDGSSPGNEFHYYESLANIFAPATQPATINGISVVTLLATASTPIIDADSDVIAQCEAAADSACLALPGPTYPFFVDPP